MRRDLVIVACAISAGIHGALVPDHLEEGLGPGLGFAAGAALLATVAVAVTLLPGSELALWAAAVVLLGLLASYVLATTTGVPVLHPEPEPVTGLALATKAIEAIGLGAIVAAHTELKGTPTWTRPGPSAQSLSR